MLGPYGIIHRLRVRTGLSILCAFVALTSATVGWDSVRKDGLLARDHEHQTLTGLPPCDAIIDHGLSDRLSFPTDEEYAQSIASYWSLNARLLPWCIVQPRSTPEVAQVMKALASAGGGAGDWHIAIRSGGHTADGVNNVAKGVTIDLSMMNRTLFHPSNHTASLEPGARWAGVYSDLLPYNVTVVGGRDGGVGVGGLLLGGGISYFSGIRGLACDTVLNFEVVLADGRIVNANSAMHPDLWRALKGGGSNFGIVTRFDVSTLSTSEISYEQRIMSSSYSQDFIHAIVNFTSASNSRPDDAIIPFWTHSSSSGNASGINVFSINVNLRGQSNSSAFDSIRRIPAESDTIFVESIAAAAINSELAGGGLNTGSTLTFRNDARILAYAVELHEELVHSLADHLGSNNFTTFWFLEPFPARFGQLGREAGGNVLSLPVETDAIVWNGGISLSTSHLDLAYAHAELQRITSDLASFSRSLGGHIDFVYMNYADPSQDPLGSYGRDSIAEIREVAARFDPTGVFQYRIPGGFKVSRVR